MQRNEAISCTIQNCKHHWKNADYCSLAHINVGTHEANPTVIECTDCQSFEYCCK